VPAPDADALQSTPKALEIVSTKTIGELTADPASRAVLLRCVPELIPNPAIQEYLGRKTLEQLKGELDITLTDAKLRRIDAELARALAEKNGSQ
jgi:hypothetical protein